MVIARLLVETAWKLLNLKHYNQRWQPVLQACLRHSLPLDESDA